MQKWTRELVSRFGVIIMKDLIRMLKIVLMPKLFVGISS